MVLKNVGIVIICTTLSVWNGRSMADEYRPDEFLSLDLSKALLSPKPLGPPTEFAPVAVEAKGDRANERTQVRAEPGAEPKVVDHKTRVTHAHAEKPRGAVRTKLARPHRNPLDAQAFDTRIQVWPCRSGGICNWKR